MQRTEIDGVTTFWEQGPEPFTAILMFRAGARHETFRTGQVSHLVEHLVMSTLPKTHLEHNAQVDADTTSFYATGRPDEVVDFLARLCAGIRGLPLDRVEREAGVLQAEDGTSEHPAVCWSIGVRFDLTGIGLLGAAGPGPRHLSAEHAAAYAARHLVRGNAVLVLSGPPPEGLRLDLPDGPQPVEQAARRSAFPLPALNRAEMPFPTISFEVPGTRDNEGVLAAILQERLSDDLRQDRGIAYSCEVGLLRLEESTLVTVWTDGHEERRAEIAGALWACVRDLATQGPTQAELDHAVAWLSARLTDPRNTVDWVAAEAYRHLVGLPPRTREGYLASLGELTTDDVRRRFASGLDTVLLGVPQDVQLVVDDLTDHTDAEFSGGEPVRGEVFARRTLSLAPRDLRFVAGPEGISQTAHGYTAGARWDGVVGVAVADGIRHVVLETGQPLCVMRRHVKDTDRLFAIIDAHTADRAFPATEEEILGG